MSEQDLQTHLDKGRYGAPLINPDEQHKYLGTFRERCYLSMTITEMKNAAYRQAFTLELKNYPEAKVLLNGAAPEALQGTYIQLISQAGRNFTIINDHVSNDPESVGLLLVTDEAVDEPEIDIAKKHPVSQKKEAPAKPSFFKKLFGKDTPK